MIHLRSAINVVLGFAVAYCVGSGTAQAFAIVTSGVSAVVMAPAADTLTLNAASITQGFGTFTLQTGVFTINDSGSTTGTFQYNLTENVTINGETQALKLLAQDVVGLNSDTITIFASQPVYFLNTNSVLTTRTYNFVSTVKTDNFNLTADLVPEPSTLGLFGAALLALGATRRKRPFSA